MFTRLIRRLRKIFARLTCCSQGNHTYSRARARQVDGEWQSVCRNCGAPMQRLSKRKWTIIS